MLRSFIGHYPDDLNPAFIIVGLVIGIAVFAFYIFMTQYIYKDASKRNLNAEMWLLMAFIVPVFSWIVYFIVRNKIYITTYCHSYCICF